MDATKGSGHRARRSRWPRGMEMRCGDVSVSPAIWSISAGAVARWAAAWSAWSVRNEEWSG